MRGSPEPATTGTFSGCPQTGSTGRTCQSPRPSLCTRSRVGSGECRSLLGPFLAKSFCQVWCRKGGPRCRLHRKVTEVYSKSKVKTENAAEPDIQKWVRGTRKLYTVGRWLVMMCSCEQKQVTWVRQSDWGKTWQEMNLETWKHEENLKTRILKHKTWQNLKHENNQNINCDKKFFEKPEHMCQCTIGLFTFYTK